MQKVDGRKAFAIAVFAGLILGKLIKKFALGMLLGILLSLLYVLIRYPSAGKRVELQRQALSDRGEGIWYLAYAGVIILLIVLVFFFYHFTRFFA